MASNNGETCSRISNPDRLNTTSSGNQRLENGNVSKLRKIPDQDSNINVDKILKVAFAVFLFMLVFSSGFIARITLHIMLWQQNPPTINTNTDVKTFGGVITFNCSSCHNNTNSCQEIAISRVVDINWIWAMFIVIITPYFITFLRTLFRILLKQNKDIVCTDFFIVMLVETLNCIGESLLTFVVLPSFDPVTASVVYLGIAIVPPIVDILDKIFSDKKDKNDDSQQKTKLAFCLSIFGLVLQLVGIVLLSIYSAELWLMLSYIVSCLCISVRHWENFVTMEGDGFFRRVKKSLQRGKTKIECLANLWKIILTFVLVICINVGKVTNTKEGAGAIFGKGQATLRSAFGGRKLGNDLTCWDYAPYVVALVKIISDYMYYKASKTVCVINCQRIGFSVPTFIIPVVTSLSLAGMIHTPIDFKLESVDLFLYDIFCWLGFKQASGKFFLVPISFLVLLLSYLIIARHVWLTNGYKHGETARIFVIPFYCGITTELSMLLNRRRHDKEYCVITEQAEKSDIETGQTANGNGQKAEETGKRAKEKRKKAKVKGEDDKEKREKVNRKGEEGKENVPMRFVCCATMWHETKNEMLQLMKSIYR